MTNVLDKTVQELRASLPPLLTVAKAAEVSQLSPSTLHRAIRAGKLPFNQPAGPGGEVRLPRDAVLAWAFALQVHEPPAQPEPPRPEKPRQRERPERRAPRKRRAPLRVVGKGASAWSEAEMLKFAAAYTG